MVLKLWHCSLSRSIRPLWTMEEMGLEFFELSFFSSFACFFAAANATLSIPPVHSVRSRPVSKVTGVVTICSVVIDIFALVVV